MLAGAHTSEAIQAIERDMAPMLAAPLERDPPERRRCSPGWTRFTSSAASLGLTAEQARVLERYHALFRRAGAGLDAAAKQRLKEIGDRLASLGTAFGQNVLADEQSYVMPLGEDDLAGLPDFARAAARGAAEERGLKGQHAVTLGRSSVEPFLQFSARRELREKAFRAWIARGDNGGKTDNKPIIAELTALRDEKRAPARLSELRALQARRHDGEDAGGRDRPARRRVGAGAPPRRRGARRAAGHGRGRRRQLPRSRHGTGAITPRSCARRATISTRAEIKPYLPLDSIIEAAFYTANRLFGLTFTPRQRRAGLSSRRARLGGERGRTGATSACSSATISRGPPSAAAPG